MQWPLGRTTSAMPTLGENPRGLSTLPMRKVLQPLRNHVTVPHRQAGIMVYSTLSGWLAFIAVSRILKDGKKDDS